MVVAAGEVAGTDLGLLMESSGGNANKGQWETVFFTFEGERIVIRTNRKTPQLVEFQIDVGWFGSEPTARLILKRMAVAINLDSDRDGSGEILLPPPPAPSSSGSDTPEAPPVDETPPHGEGQPAPRHNDPADDEAPESHRGGAST